ncbi:41581_t:CDS:2, partial [Gigaspora margarita]
LEKAIEYYKKWMMLWYHLPLSICNLEGDSSQSFARNTWLKPPTEQEITYANQLREDFKVKNYNDFGLHKNITQDINFRCEFEDYCITENPLLYKFMISLNFEHASFEGKQEIGKGRFGVMYKAYLKDIKQIVALKTLYYYDNNSLGDLVKK